MQNEYRLKMSKNCFLIIFMICELFKNSFCIAKKNSTAWSTVNLFVDNTDLHTTETFGIIIKTNESHVTSPNDLWTKIDVTVPPQRSLLRSKYHATFGNVNVKTTAAGERSIQTEKISEIYKYSTQLPTPAMSISTNRSLIEEVSPKTPRKGVNGETGHAFFYDDDDDDDDYEEDDDDDEYIQKKDEEDDEDDDVADSDKIVEEPAEALDAEQQEEYENYAETRPPIILRTRRKNKRKRGKKHGSIKIKDFKKLRKFMLPLLLAYKLKFFTLVPLLLGGLVLIVATTGFAGFFFALFAVGLGLKHHH